MSKNIKVQEKATIPVVAFMDIDELEKHLCEEYKKSVGNL